MTANRIEVSLTSEQKEAISEIEYNLQIIACAGSGKTEVITRRIANILQNKHDIKPENIVAFTFTEKAAESMKIRITEALGDYSSHMLDKMYIGTIHGFCHDILKKCTDQFKDYKILDTVKSHLFIARYCAECGMSDLSLDLCPRNVSLFLECIDKMIDDYDNADSWTQEQRDVLNKYMECLYSHNYIDFALMIFKTLRQIESNPEVKEFLSQIKYLVVDEYQDVNDLQEKLIHSIAECGANICVVGDDDQTIYQFRGSNADNMILFSQRYSGVHQVRLQKNFRCAPGIVDVADCVIRHNDRRIVKKMVSGVQELHSIIEAKRFSNKEEQFDKIAQRIIELHNTGIPYNEMAILVRKGKVIAQISSALDQARIPFEADSAKHFFTGNYFNRFVATLQILSDIDKAKPKLYECWQDLAERSAFNAGFKFLRSCSRGGNLPLSKIIQGFCEKIGFLDENEVDFEIRKINLDGIKKILDDYDEIYGDWQFSARIKGVLKFLGTQAADEYKYYSFEPKKTNTDAVQIMTVHKSKGLEFHTVFLPELTKREFPVSNFGGKKYYHVLGGVFEENKNRYQSDLEDERKLFYVAVTRAKQNLYMTYELLDQPVSCFVRESAESSFMTVDKEDLLYDPVKQRQEYWEMVKYARHELYEYYGSGARYYPAMHLMLNEIKNWTPEQILDEASRKKLI